VGKSLFFAYVAPEFVFAGSEFEIVVMDDRRKATVMAEAAWDPESVRLRS
jgi:dimethylglycine dehydrogenase